MDTLVIFSNTLKRLRKERGLRQQDVADDLVMTRERLSSYENNNSSPDPHVVAQFAKYYDVSSDFLLGLTDERRKYTSTDAADYLHRSLLDILSGLTESQQDEIVKSLMRYARFLKNDVKDFT
ncbi:helix-turn-helix domain-containing protein [Bacillus cereus group sp. TH160LC]|uniref:helix-turn-helix domain-containing protein n=1 Tax=Bacillus cereus group sp. TH160LC TaxID=3018058 RepID=UPI0022E9945D|nr:helix-turn-helix transcriptional regulator [Bacillus cereus group sp. TH160LC]MDA1651017.1 helix-turn-helix transcriptional regulator [Bacillus cereus group sp. TH160LC]